MKNWPTSPCWFADSIPKYAVRRPDLSRCHVSRALWCAMIGALRCQRMKATMSSHGENQRMLVLRPEHLCSWQSSCTPNPQTCNRICHAAVGWWRKYRWRRTLVLRGERFERFRWVQLRRGPSRSLRMTAKTSNRTTKTSNRRGKNRQPPRQEQTTTTAKTNNCAGSAQSSPYNRGFEWRQDR